MPYGGWERCARLVSGELEAIVTLEVGPRVIRFGFVGEENEFSEYAKDRGKKGGETYRSYGGHRLWIAPEDRGRTYEADNEPVEVLQAGRWTCFKTPVGATGLHREIRIASGSAEVSFELEHRITNLTENVVELAPWSITVMAPGGTCVFPQADFRAQPDALLPARPLVLWHYTNMQDPRFTWGERLVRLRQDSSFGATKVGSLVQQGWGCYANRDRLFVKRFTLEHRGNYPDFGCNFETFAREDMLEIESLSPLVRLNPGESASHYETWYLLKGFFLPDNELVCSAKLEDVMGRCPETASKKE